VDDATVVVVVPLCRRVSIPDVADPAMRYTRDAPSGDVAEYGVQAAFGEKALVISTIPEASMRPTARRAVLPVYVVVPTAWE
jgi:hypothetical protein